MLETLEAVNISRIALRSHLNIGTDAWRLQASPEGLADLVSDNVETQELWWCELWSSGILMIDL